MATDTPPALDIEQAVRDRYSGAAQAREAALCCPVDYDARYLEAIPEQVLERDYGCGDPSRYVREGDTVLDLGSGAGKICFIASQIVGAKGTVLGVDLNDEMLALARAAAPKVAEKTGYENTRFLRGEIQDLALDVSLLEEWLAAHPVSDRSGMVALQEEIERLRRDAPLVADGSVDLVVSNCVLNLVRDRDKSQMIREIYRVLRRGGRIAISDIVADEEVPAALKADPELWSGCVSGAFEEREFLAELEAAGFYGITIDKWEEVPFRTVQGIEFRSITVTARKGKEGACYEANQALIYRGPWRQVEDDDGHVFRRGERVAVCEKTFSLLLGKPYGHQLTPVEPRTPVADADRAPFDCHRSARRDPRETKGATYRATTEEGTLGSDCC